MPAGSEGFGEVLALILDRTVQERPNVVFRLVNLRIIIIEQAPLDRLLPGLEVRIEGEADKELPQDIDP
ncbi:hypothetical protein D3C87_1933480 [compost metagenome]